MFSVAEIEYKMHNRTNNVSLYDRLRMFIATFVVFPKVFQFLNASLDRAEFEADKLVVALILAVVFIVIAVVLIPVVLSNTATTLNNQTEKALFPATFSLIQIIPLVFVVGILVTVVILMLRARA